MIQAGRHKAKAIEWKLGMTSTGKEQIAVLFQLDDGQTIPYYGYFTDQTTERTLESLEYMGWDGNDITDPKGLDKNEVSLVVEYEKSEKDGKDYPKVRWVNRLGGGLGVKEELTGGALMSFKQRMQGAVLARKQKSASQGKSGSRSNGGNAADDDLPF